MNNANDGTVDVGGDGIVTINKITIKRDLTKWDNMNGKSSLILSREINSS